MRRSRALLGLVGGAVFLLGVAITLSPSTADAVPLDGAVEALGGPYVFVAAFAVAAVVVLLAVLLARAIEGIDESTPPDPEEVYRVPSPGQGFDEFVDGGVNLRARLFGDRHERVRDRLYRTAVATLVRAEGMSRAEARESLERGTWTDDEAAAAFFADRRTSRARGRLAAVVRGGSTFQHGARRAAEAIARQEELR